jgi:transcriptional regulator with XRE-family HTH domain
MPDRWNIPAMRRDLDLRGWQPSDLARKAGVSPSTVLRFFRGEFQTARTANKLARALGRTPRAYLVEEHI